MARIDCDLCVIGAGSGGLSVAAGAAQLGARVVLIERGAMGGDCLNSGCVPSKALIAAAKAASTVRKAATFGLSAELVRVDWAKVNDHVQGVIAAIAPHDSQERFEALGCTVLRASAAFKDPRTVIAGDHQICAKRFVIATGSSPLVPPIPGLDGVDYLTNEQIFHQRAAMPRLLVIGGGPIGCELAQAQARLGSQVTLFEMGGILAKDDPELVAAVRSALQQDGVVLQERCQVTAVAKTATGVEVTFVRDGQSQRVEGSHLLVAVGRKANVTDLNLDAAGINHSPRGIAVSRSLKTSNRRVFALGDVAQVAGIGAYQFTHAAGYQAGIVIRQALFKLPSKVDYRAFPWVTYCDPELATVGMTAAQAEKDGVAVTRLTWLLTQNDRAQAERATDGRLIALVDRKGRILGASIVGPRAGELIHAWGLAIQSGLKIGAMTNCIAAYPTLAEASKRLAGSFYTDRLFSDRTRRLVRWLLRF